ncbi:MAG: MG2 domain-containing protein, partial [Bacteroidales bacterium]|nr:MG2 domain-containing protein [Bacteroidales bacterium]
MKKLLVAIALCMASLGLWAQKDYAKEWQQIDDQMNTAQPQSALTIVEQIYNESRVQDNHSQFVKACLYRMQLKKMYEEEALVKIIEELEVLLPATTVPTKNILHSIVAEQYWNYYQNNRWIFNNRTAVEVQPEDIRTWDLRLIVAKCEAHYAASLDNINALQKININDYKVILDKQKDSEKYRPTLFDFLAFRAVEFYNNNEANLLQPTEQFLVNKEEYFASAPFFSSLKITTSDTVSFNYQALKYLQQIITFHLADADPTALIDADLQRLDMVYKHTALSNKDSLYIAALQDLDNRYSHHISSTEVLYRMAKRYKEQGEVYDPFTKPTVQWKKKEAMALLEKAMARFPKSFGAESCRALKSEIEQPEITLTMDNAVLPNKPVLASLQYQNVKKIFFRIAALDYKEAMEWQRTENQDTYYAKLKALHTWSVELPDLGDYQKHTVELALPELKEGYYVIQSSIDGAFTDKSMLWKENKLWATNISLVRQNKSQGAVEVMALHRESGQPLRGVEIQTFSRNYNYTTRRYEVLVRDALTANSEGIVTLPTTNTYLSLGLLATLGNDHYVQADNLILYGEHDVADRYTTTFFTDRAIYRPGQTVYFKGLVMLINEQSEKTEIVKNYKQKIIFYNVNYEKVAEQEVESNEFGSFAGSFVIPTIGLTGQMRIQAQKAGGSVAFQVEEYKRPKFEVSFASVAGSYRLNEELTVSGLAKAYAGNAISEAKVSYRVMRQARYPFWRWWWGSMPSSPAQEIANGIIETKADGSFDIVFKAMPDAAIAEKEAPVFHYTVSATVSDITGETHEAQTTVAVGYQSLLLSTDISEKINIDEWKNLTINTTNLNGQPQAAQGTLTIWKLREPMRVLQSRNWQRPDQFILSRAEFEKIFPYSVYDNEDNVADWEKEQAVYTLSFDTQENNKYAVNAKEWKLGKYLVELKTQDAFGQAVETSTMFTGFSTAQKTVPANEIAWFNVLSASAQPNETVKVALGSACKNVRVLLEVNEKDKAAKRQYITLNSEQKVIEIPVLESYRGNFGIDMFFVKDNRVYARHQVINVPYDNKKLAVEWATFRDKLLPGQEEEWRLTIKDNKGDAVLAELLASMYDASLDVFAPHTWNFFPWSVKYIMSAWTTNTSFRIGLSTAMQSNYAWAPMPERFYDRLMLSGGYYQ